MSTNKRKQDRHLVRQQGVLINDDGSIIGPCVMLDVSAGGAKLKLRDEIEVNSDFTLWLSKGGRTKRRCKLAWRLDKTIGVRFI